MTKIIVNGNKPHLVEAFKQMENNTQTLLETGDPHLHKIMTFAQRYSQSKNKDPRIFSRDPEVIKEYWSDFWGVKK